MRLAVIILLCSVASSGCFWGDDGDEIDINERYYLRSNRPGDTYHLGFIDDAGIGVGIVNDPIVAVGYNKDYIILKAKSGHYMYYIVSIIDAGNHQTATENIEGVKNEKSFNERITELASADLKFTKTFENQ